MGQRRSYHLSLGSNISPERNLLEAIRQLRARGSLIQLSSVWESHAVGSDGPNFLNACVHFEVDATLDEVKRLVVQEIETSLGRIRTSEKNAPRTIDIDIILDGLTVANRPLWQEPFVIVPMAELLPHMPHPVTGRSLEAEAADAKASTWLRRRPDVLAAVTDSGEP